MITFEIGGGLGNRLFQYVFARLLAEKLGFSLETRCSFEGVITPTEPKQGKIFTNNKQHIVETNKTEDLFEKKWQNCHINLQGFWQEQKYYTPHRESILGYFKEKATEKTDRENIVMHVRLKDYKWFGNKGNVIDSKYYFDCLKRERFNRLFIVTDEPDDQYFEPFESLQPIFTRGNIKNDFWFLTEFDRIILGNSTFSWWAAFLSNATKIYTPKCWIRNSTDIRHELHVINNGKCSGIQMPAEFIDY